MASRSIDWQRAFIIPLTILAWLVLVVVVGWLLGHVLRTVLTLVLSGVVAFALTPLVSYLERWMPRGLAVAVAYLVGVGLVAGLIAFVVVTAAAQVTNLVDNLPVYAREAQRFEPQIARALGPFGVSQARVHSAEQQVISSLQSLGTTAARQTVDIVTGVVGTIIDIILVLILSIYLTANGQKIAAWMRRQTPSPQRRQTILLIAIVNRVVGGYIRGQLTLAALIGFLVGAGLLVLHVPYAVLLGVLAFFMEFIPVLGVFVSGAVSVLIALTQGWILAAIVLGYFVGVHVVEGDVVGPRIMGRAVGIHPATALVALVAGTELFGIWGALFGAPLAGLIQALATAAWREVVHGADPETVLRAVVETQKEQAAREQDEDEAAELERMEREAAELERAEQESMQTSPPEAGSDGTGRTDGARAEESEPKPVPK
jgi:predicted PurR-regulated permease PerM